MAERAGEMDGFDNLRVVVKAETNRASALDSTLTSPGRFDRIISRLLPAAQPGGAATRLVGCGKNSHQIHIHAAPVLRPPPRPFMRQAATSHAL